MSNLRCVRPRIAWIARFLGSEVDDAIEIAMKIDTPPYRQGLCGCAIGSRREPRVDDKAVSRPRAA